MMHCVRCTIDDDNDQMIAVYVYEGSSLCRSHFVAAVETPPAPGSEVAIPEQPKSKRGTRLPAAYVPAQATIDGIRREFPFVTSDDLTAAHREFCDYWVAVPGQRGTKLDWEATWRNSMRREFNGKRWDSRRRGANSTVDQKIIDMQGKKQ